MEQTLKNTFEKQYLCGGIWVLLFFYIQFNTIFCDSVSLSFPSSQLSFHKKRTFSFILYIICLHIFKLNDIPILTSTTGFARKYHTLGEFRFNYGYRSGVISHWCWICHIQVCVSRGSVFPGGRENFTRRDSVSQRSVKKACDVVLSKINFY